MPTPKAAGGGLIKGLQSGAILVLVVLAIVGTVYKIFVPGGWLSQWFKMLMGENTGTVLVVSALLVAAFVWLQKRGERSAAAQGAGNLITWVLVGVGLYYVVIWYLHGSI